jgi:ferrous iron transport protein B
MKRINISLIGNPNSGKSSLFNHLTGLRQHVSNFPGVTVDKKIGVAILADGTKVDVIDLPGTYSLFPNSSDERLVIDLLTDVNGEDYPDLIVYVADLTQLERHLLLATQIADLKIPMILCLNMIDLVGNEEGKKYIKSIQNLIGVPTLAISGKTGENVNHLKELIQDFSKGKKEKYIEVKNGYTLSTEESAAVKAIEGLTHTDNPYLNKIIAHHHKWLSHLDPVKRATLSDKLSKTSFDDIKYQVHETMERFKVISPLARKTLDAANVSTKNVTDKIDDVITHRVLGPIIFLAIMMLVFQSVYAWAEYPMMWIEEGFAALGNSTRNILPASWFSDLIVDGIIAGLGGIMVFIPQITILFFIIAILEEIGYMSRAVFMFDGIMQRFGLNGRSIVSLVSSSACAIPAIMATRTISNWKERLITIMVSPLISCSARIPVYTVLVGFVVAPGKVMGVFNAQGLAFMGLYLLGILAALVSAFVFKQLLRTDESSFLLIELPQYKPPIWKNVVLTLKEKVGTFIIEAGKVILIISIILWFMASYGPSGKMEKAEAEAMVQATELSLDQAATDNLVASKKIEASYAGHLGKIIEPAIKPLGFDWKIGIALITSFAAREVFVGTMATIYSVGSSDDEATVREKMAAERDPVTLKPRYDIATSLSLLIFYVFAMQCMSTLAVTKRETKSWKWPIIQFSYMSALAYLGSLLAYQLLS